VGIQNKLHHESAISDPKTGLYNSAYFMKRLGEEIARADRHGSSSGILMLDIDFFKRFNDTWGHLAGDAVLRALSRILTAAVRNEDIPARFGGEEFCVLLVECDERKLFAVAERIRRAIEEMRVPFKSEQLAVTVSVGVCPLEPSWKGSPESFIERVDKALYRSKATGRNRSTLYRFGLLGRATNALEKPV
jgi:diguanylate cyclase (GGDEF)-like protein